MATGGSRPGIVVEKGITVQDVGDSIVTVQIDSQELGEYLENNKDEQLEFVFIARPKQRSGDEDGENKSG